MSPKCSDGVFCKIDMLNVGWAKHRKGPRYLGRPLCNLEKIFRMEGRALLFTRMAITRFFHEFKFHVDRCSSKSTPETQQNTYLTIKSYLQEEPNLHIPMSLKVLHTSLPDLRGKLPPTLPIPPVLEGGGGGRDLGWILFCPLEWLAVGFTISKKIKSGRG